MEYAIYVFFVIRKSKLYYVLIRKYDNYLKCIIMKNYKYKFYLKNSFPTKNIIS